MDRKYAEENAGLLYAQEMVGQIQNSVVESDDDEEIPGRVLTDEEYSRLIRERESDIFSIDRNRVLRNVEIISLVMAMGAGAFLSTREVTSVASDFFDKIPEERAVTMRDKVVDARINQNKPEKKPEVKPQNDRKVLKPSKAQGSGGMSGGGGDPKARVTKMGVLGLVSGQIRGKAVASADIFGRGGFASDIDAMLSGMGGLKQGGDGGVGRREAAGIGFGNGVGSGFGGGGPGIGDLLNSLMGPDGSALGPTKTRGTLNLRNIDIGRGGSLNGGRSRVSINMVVNQNIAALRYAYNSRLREKPGLNGRITVKFAIDEFGKVIYVQITESTINDEKLEQTVLSRIRNWAFERIDKPGDVTEVVYPFVFSQ